MAKKGRKKKKHSSSNNVYNETSETTTTSPSSYVVSISSPTTTKTTRAISETKETTITPTPLKATTTVPSSSLSSTPYNNHVTNNKNSPPPPPSSQRHNIRRRQRSSLSAINIRIQPSSSIGGNLSTSSLLGNGYNNSMTHEHLLLINAADARRLITPHDDENDDNSSTRKLMSNNNNLMVLLLIPSPLCPKNGNDDNVSFGAICHVRIVSPSSTSTSKKKNLLPGDAILSPKCLEERLFHTESSSLVETINDNGNETSPTTPSSKPITTPSKIGYSFKDMVSPSSVSSTPTATTPSKKSPLHPRHAIIIPLQSHFNHKLLSSVIGVATHVTLSPPMNTDMSFSGLLFRRLCLASLNGCYLRRNDAVVVPYRGRQCRCTVVNIGQKTRDDRMEEMGLSDELERLSLTMRERGDEEDMTEEEMDELEDWERWLLQRRKNRDDALLFRVSHDTTIDIQSSSSDTSSSSPAAAPSVPPPVIIGGCDGYFQQLLRALTPSLFQPHLFQNNSSPLSPPTGVLLHGPSGVGKSLLATQLTHHLTSLTPPIIVKTIICPHLLSTSSIHGHTERTLSHLLSSPSTTTTPTLLILDDINALLPHRRNAPSSTSKRICSTLLALIDGLSSPSSSSSSTNNLTLLGICRNVHDLDPACRRPGRFDSEIEMTLPDENQKMAIWNVLHRHYCDGSTMVVSPATYREWARLSRGFTGADILYCLKESCRSGSSSTSEIKNDIKSIIKRTVPSGIRGTMGLVEVPKVRWEDIGGMEHVKTRLKEVLRPVGEGLLRRWGVTCRARGVLLYGPPGCSKTLMARALATQSSYNFLAIKGPELLSKWLGESERGLAGVFHRARRASPCLLFFDEMDAIAGKRGGDGGGGERMVSQLLTELDGIGTNNNYDDDERGRVVVVGATNRPDLLDPALLRPGRMDQLIYVGVPDRSSRKQILTLSLKDKVCDDDVDVDALAMVTEGYSGAELVGLVREGALFVLEEDGDRIEMRHLVKAAGGMKRMITREMLDFYDGFRRVG